MDVSTRNRDDCGNLPFKTQAGKRPEKKAVIMMRFKKDSGQPPGVYVCCCYNYDWYDAGDAKGALVHNNFCNQMSQEQVLANCKKGVCTQFKYEHVTFVKDYIKSRGKGYDWITPAHMRKFENEIKDASKRQSVPNFKRDYGCPM